MLVTDVLEGGIFMGRVVSLREGVGWGGDVCL